jgi:hypothetical protein
MSAPKRKRRRLLLRVLLAVVFTGLVLLLVCAVVVYRLTSAAPAWWSPVDAAAPETVQAARAIENDVTTLTHTVRGNSAEPADTWSLTIPEDKANAWLATRLGAWMENQSADFTWPRAVSPPQIQIRAGKLNLGLAVRGNRGVLWTTLTPEFRPDGSLWVTAGSFSLGRLGVPASWALAEGSRLIADKSKPGATRAIEALQGKRALVEHPVVTLSDGRRVRLVGFRVIDGALDFTCRTEPPRH